MWKPKTVAQHSANSASEVNLHKILVSHLLVPDGSLLLLQAQAQHERAYTSDGTNNSSNANNKRKSHHVWPPLE